MREEGGIGLNKIGAKGVRKNCGTEYIVALCDVPGKLKYRIHQK